MNGRCGLSNFAPLSLFPDAALDSDAKRDRLEKYDSTIKINKRDFDVLHLKKQPDLQR